MNGTLTERSDFVVLADGRRYARVWDASQYPSLYTYVEGGGEDTATAEAKEHMQYEPKQLFNKSMFMFQARASLGVTPYNAPPLFHESFVRASSDSKLWKQLERQIEDLVEKLNLGWAAHELMPTIPRQTVGVDADGNRLEDPADPFPSAEGMFFPAANELPPE